MNELLTIANGYFEKFECISTYSQAPIVFGAWK